MPLRFEEQIKQITDKKNIESGYFKLLKDSILHYMKETYKVKIAEKNTENKLKASLDLVAEGTKAHSYAHALNAGGDVLLKACEGLVIEQMNNSSIRDERWRTYQNEMRRIDRKSIAFKNVLI